MAKDKSNKLEGPAPGEKIIIQHVSGRVISGVVQGHFDDAIVILNEDKRFVIAYKEYIEAIWTEPMEASKEEKESE
jgi:sRNA-binding regulator protein Hfq